jgi:phospholipase/lecithinase/hemolysin
MNRINAWGCTIVGALLLGACGGGGSSGPDPATSASALHAGRNITSVISFGDSLSDAGTYTPATAIPGTDPPVYLGGKFTTNSATGTIWVENIAATLGLVVTPAEVGFAGQSVHCPAAAQGLGTTCTAYGQGGSRVTDPNGKRHAAGALTVPVKTQIANHLARFGRFQSRDLILVWAGANDLLWEVEPDPAVNPNSFVVKLFQIQAQVQAGALSPDQANALLSEALATSQAAMKLAARQLAGYIRSEILDKGGRTVAVLNLPDPVSTPEGSATAAALPVLGAAMTSLADAFNLALAQGLQGQEARLIDVRGVISDVVARPSAYGMVNASVPACDAAKMSLITGGAVTDGFSLFCNATPGAPYNGIRDGADVRTWFFADGNHPTTGGYKVISDAVLRQLDAFGWLGTGRQDE